MYHTDEQTDTYRVETRPGHDGELYYVLRCPDGTLMRSFRGAISAWCSEAEAQSVAQEANEYLIAKQGE